MALKNSRKIVVLATGGTIAGLARQPTDPGYTAAVLPVSDLLGGLDLGSDGAWTLESEQVAQIDSKDMTPTVWAELARRCAAHLASPEVAGLVITHGTDTAEETAFFLQCVLRPAKPVALTCAMRPANAPDADGPGNLQDAVNWVRLSASSTQVPAQVVLVAAGEVHAASVVQKIFSDRLDAFSSGPNGPLARIAQSSLQWGNAAAPWICATPPVTALGDGRDWPEVRLVHSHAGADGREVRALMSSSHPPRGWVVAGTGAGTLHQDLAAALDEARQRGAVVWCASRCAWGVVPERRDDGLHAAGGLSPVKARIALMLSLMA